MVALGHRTMVALFTKPCSTCPQKYFQELHVHVPQNQNMIPLHHHLLNTKQTLSNINTHSMCNFYSALLSEL